ncbi:serine/threonine protein kinase [bacterium]|nr:serine/threonine protein kinase [bacterium]MDC0311996.1 serine/threonine protein kinase [bacterium]
MLGALETMPMPDHLKPSGRLPELGEVFGGYRIGRELGRGGMGAVFEAEQLETGRVIALKLLNHQLDSPEARARFLREGRLAASINHPNSVYVFGTEEIGEMPAISMELVGGGTLEEIVKARGALPIGEAVDMISQVVEGLEAAEEIGILHRDVKPGNCFQDVDGTVKIGDFGLSISAEARDKNLLTMDGTIFGTPAFSSPEQLRGDELNVQSDIYAVGATLFYLLTGKAAFGGKSVAQLFANVLESKSPSPKKKRPDIPEGLAAIVLRCLRKIPFGRFGSYLELRKALAAFKSDLPSPANSGLRFLAGTAD